MKHRGKLLKDFPAGPADIAKDESATRMSRTSRGPNRGIERLLHGDQARGMAVDSLLFLRYHWVLGCRMALRSVVACSLW
jgi:hypothetical protein